MTGETLLSILKVTSEGLTAAFGIFGLLTEFKDEKTKQIKKNGKIALCGIIMSFIVSGAITALENANARAAERAHANETAFATIGAHEIASRLLCRYASAWIYLEQSQANTRLDGRT